MAEHCTDNNKDRKTGAHWERMFCSMSAEYGLTLTPLQIGRKSSAQAYYKENNQWKHLTLPDITIWSDKTEHHEIKHKNPTRANKIGLEVYRFNALKQFRKTTLHNVMYTIHNHDLNDTRESKINNINHWLTCSIDKLQAANYTISDGYSWVGGVKKVVPIMYWDYENWKPLKEWFEYRNKIIKVA